MAETTSAFTRADFLNDEIDHRPALALDDTASWVQGLPDVDSRRAYSSCQVWNPCFVVI
jgi:hypothetical protein